MCAVSDPRQPQRAQKEAMVRVLRVHWRDLQGPAGTWECSGGHRALQREVLAMQGFDSFSPDTVLCTWRAFRRYSSVLHLTHATPNFPILFH
jgi:hypothetical protein